MGTAGAKAFGDVLLVNKTIQHLDVSDNSFGKPTVGDQVKLKSSGEIKTVTGRYGDGEHADCIKFDGCQGLDGGTYPHGYVKPDSYKWLNQVPVFCAGLAASTSLLSVRAFCHSLHEQFDVLTRCCSDCCPRLCVMSHVTCHTGQCLVEWLRPRHQGHAVQSKEECDVGAVTPSNHSGHVNCIKIIKYRLIIEIYDFGAPLLVASCPSARHF